MALVLAAVVSPPDAVTAVAIGGRLGLPTRVLNTLKGESLVNDAAALTLFSVTVASATHSAGDHHLPSNPVLFFLATSAIGVATGFALGHVAAWVRARLTEASLMTAFAVLLPFAAYGLAEVVEGSGVLAVVTAGFVLSRHSLAALYATRMSEREFWNILDVLLEAFVFAYLGLQFHFLLADAVTDGARAVELLVAGVVVLAAVVLVRLVWIVAGGFVMRNLLHGRFSPGGRHFTPAEDVVLAWTGMRGVVTLAAAAGLPEDFPHRADLQVLAFVVAVGTLLLQGSTLPALIRHLDLDTTRERPGATPSTARPSASSATAWSRSCARRGRRRPTRPNATGSTPSWRAPTAARRTGPRTPRRSRAARAAPGAPWSCAGPSSSRSGRPSSRPRSPATSTRTPSGRCWSSSTSTRPRSCTAAPPACEGRERHRAPAPSRGPAPCGVDRVVRQAQRE